MSTTAPSTATSSACAASSARSTPSSTRSRRSMASDTALRRGMTQRGPARSTGRARWSLTPPHPRGQHLRAGDARGRHLLSRQLPQRGWSRRGSPDRGEKPAMLRRRARCGAARPATAPLIASSRAATTRALRLYDSDGPRLIGQLRDRPADLYAARSRHRSPGTSDVARALDRGIDAIVGAAAPPLIPRARRSIAPRLARGGRGAATSGLATSCCRRAPDRTPVITAARAVDLDEPQRAAPDASTRATSPAPCAPSAARLALVARARR